MKIAADADDVIIGTAFHLIDDDLRTLGDVNWTLVRALRPNVINELEQ